MAPRGKNIVKQWATGRKRSWRGRKEGERRRRHTFHIMEGKVDLVEQVQSGSPNTKLQSPRQRPQTRTGHDKWLSRLSNCVRCSFEPVLDVGEQCELTAKAKDALMERCPVRDGSARTVLQNHMPNPTGTRRWQAPKLPARGSKVAREGLCWSFDASNVGEDYPEAKGPGGRRTKRTRPSRGRRQWGPRDVDGSRRKDFGPGQQQPQPGCKRQQIFATSSCCWSQVKKEARSHIQKGEQRCRIGKS